MNEMILAGDVGGTKVNLALFDAGGAPTQPRHQQTYSTQDFASFETVVEQFLKDAAHGDASEGLEIRAACIGAAGPISQGVCKATNIPWVIRTDQLRKQLGTDRVDLINDLVATGYGLSVIGEDRFEVLNAGKPDPQGNAVLIAPGTGLGQALLFYDDGALRPSPSEGGHCDFSPTNDLEIALLKYVTAHHGRASFEMIVSGPGLLTIYRFLLDTGRREPDPAVAERIAQSQDPSAEISRAALEGECPVCASALDLFVACLGIDAGNLALKNLATGGVYLGGGIPPKILPALRSETFMRAFTRKSPLEDLMRDIPVRVILEPRAALYGAAHRAFSL